MYEEYYITLPGGFRLPVAIVKETYVFREVVPVSEENPEGLRQFAEHYVQAQMIAGRILNASITFEASETGLYLNGSFLCREMIGRIRQEKIGEYNE